jgi:urease accessory protein
MGLAMELGLRTPTLQRARGAVEVIAAVRDGRSVIADLRHAGSAKALFPRGDHARLEATLINTTGGIAGGDEFSYAGTAGEGAWLGLTTQAAERAYRARGSEIGRMTVRLAAGTGGRIDWLPQETILFDGAALDRRLEADLAADAVLLAVEAVVFGRAAMGECLARIRFTDQWRVRREGRLIYADALRIRDADALARPALLGGAGAMASVLLASPRADAMLGSVRRLLPEDAGASMVRPGVLAVRVLAPDGLALRRVLTPVLETLRPAPLPSMWRM